MHKILLIFCIFFAKSLASSETSDSINNNIDNGKTSNKDYYKSLLDSGKADTFPQAKIGENGIPQCLPDDDLIKALYYNNVETANNVGMPPWFNATLGAIGQKWVQNNLFAAFLGPVCMSILQFFAFTHMDRLTKSRRSFETRSPEKGTARLIATVIHYQVWWSQELYGPVMNKSLGRIRSIHMKAAYRARMNPEFDIRKPFQNKEMKEAEKKNAETKMWQAYMKDVAPLKEKYPEPKRLKILREGSSDEIPFNMYDMLQVSASVICPCLILAEKFGTRGTEEEIDGFLHINAGANYGLGIADAFNPALHPETKDTKKFCRDHFENYVIPNFVNMNEETMLALDDTLESAMLIFPGINTKAGWLYFFFDVFSLPAPHVYETVGFVGRVFKGAMESVLRPLLGTRVGAGIANYYLWTNYKDATRKYLHGVNLEDYADVAERAYFSGEANDLIPPS